MVRYQGVEVEDFDPRDPHCFICEDHLDGEEPIVMLLLTHETTGLKKAVVTCMTCALKDAQVASIMRDHRAFERKDLIN